MDLSIVVPIYNEEANIYKLYREIVDVITALRQTYEIIFIDDGSTDNSFSILEGISKEAEQAKINFTAIKLRRNFGKSAALLTGFKEVKGKLIITMDGDLQDDPHEIPRFIHEIKNGYDLVSGWKFKRRDPLSKVIPSRVINSIASWATGVKIHDFNCCFKVYRREVIDELYIYGELHRYIPALVAASGFQITEIKVNHRLRLYGKSKYGFKRFFEGFFDLITVIFLTKFVRKPLHFFGEFGLLSSFLGAAIIIFLYIRKFALNVPIGHNQYLFFVGILLIIVGFQFLFMGLLGELMVKVNADTLTRSCVRKKICV